MLEVYQKFWFGTGSYVFCIVLHLPTTDFFKTVPAEDSCKGGLCFGCYL